MAVTGWRIRQHLPDDLVGMVLDYMWPPSWMNAGQTGLYELCITMPDVHMVASAAHNGYVAILRDVWPYLPETWGCMYTIFRDAGRGGHADVIELALDLDPNRINDCMGGACHEGNIELVKRLIRLGARDYMLGLGYACEGTHRDCINLMIEHGARRCWNCGNCANDHAR